ncbi:MAG TPA: DUF86 domain-containing protein [Candidatus Bathyarchaeia archaeon]|nr:DUF86 domain-containing protein [Candidatus Bathyarchaeia archaeon]
MKNDKFYLRHILDAKDKIEEYTIRKTFKTFSKNDMMVDAVTRQFEIIGEAASKVSADFQEKNSNIPWSQAIGMRNRLIHEYFGVNKKIVWQTCKKDLKELKKKIAEIL